MAGDEGAAAVAEAPAMETKITNPGIADRLEKDIGGFERYGFSFDSSTRTFRAPPPPATSDAGGTCTCQVQHQHLWVTIPAPALVPSVGPFLRTLVRISDGIDPQTLRVVVSFCWSEEDVDDQEGDVDAAAAARIAHHVHMIVRNSMSAALFLTSLSILLPCNVSVNQVRDAMDQNDDVNYPSVSLVDRVDGQQNVDDVDSACGAAATANANEGRPSPPVRIYDHVSFDDNGNVSARVLIQTRMCTVRLTPILYHLARALRNECNLVTSLGNSAVSAAQMNDNSIHIPLILACVDKVANLFRIIMLARDYKSQHRLLLVVRDERIRTRLEAEMQKFIAGLDPTDDCGDGIPRIETIEDTVVLLRHECSGEIVAVDLHADALTLDEPSNNQGVDMSALSAVQSAGAVIWGFEKDGIPSAIDSMAGCYVQVRCRSSLNLVAAMSVVLHRAWSFSIKYALATT